MEVPVAGKNQESEKLRGLGCVSLAVGTHACHVGVAGFDAQLLLLRKMLGGSSEGSCNWVPANYGRPGLSCWLPISAAWLLQVFGKLISKWALSLFLCL